MWDWIWLTDGREQVCIEDEKEMYNAKWILEQILQEKSHLNDC